MNSLAEPVVTILMAVVGVAILAVIVSRNSDTANVLGAGSKAFSGILGTALSPITGQASQMPQFSAPGSLSGQYYH